MRKAIIYQVLTRLWKKGKFSSFDKRSFEYFKSLGANYIWLTGVVRHSTGKPYVKGNPGSPYSILDYYDVNPYLATNEDKRSDEFFRLIKRAHACGLKVLIDFIPNHVSPDYSDAKGGIPTLGRCDFDWTDTDKIDYSDPRTLGKMTDILLYWLSKGVDGFRCDMVELVPREALKAILAAAKAQYPEALFIGEAYDRGNYRDFIENVGFDLLYDKSGIYDALKGIVHNGETAEKLTWNWQSLGSLQENMLSFLENHDEVRVASKDFAGTPQRAYSSLAVAALFNTASVMIYFGQEAGESAPESDNCRTSIFNWTSVGSLKKPDKDVLERYRETLALAVSPVFSSGEVYDLGYCGGFDRSKFFVWLRYKGSEFYLVAASFCPKAERLSVFVPQFGRSIEVEVPSYDYTVVRL